MTQISRTSAVAFDQRSYPFPSGAWARLRIKDAEWFYTTNPNDLRNTPQARVSYEIHGDAP